MAPRNDGTNKKAMNKGAWTPEEDQRLSHYIELHGAKRWKAIAVKSGTYICLQCKYFSTENSRICQVKRTILIFIYIDQ